VHEHVGHSDGGEPKDGILEGSEVESVNSQKELLFQFLMNGCCKGDF